MEFTIKQLSKEEYAGYSFDVRYCTNKYYDVAVSSSGFNLVLKKSFKTQEKSFTDTLFGAWLEEPVAYGAFVGDTLIGFVEGSKETWHNLFRISNLFVVEEFRGMGLGKQLLAYMIEKAKEAHPYRGIILETQSCNYRAICLYRKLGFKLCRIDTHEYSNRDVERHEVRLDLILELHNNEEMEG